MCSKREWSSDVCSFDLTGGISIHAPREGSDQSFFRGLVALAISLHAPREGSDQYIDARRMGASISILAPREGSDLFWRSSSWPESGRATGREREASSLR